MLGASCFLCQAAHKLKHMHLFGMPVREDCMEHRLQMRYNDKDLYHSISNSVFSLEI